MFLCHEQDVFVRCSHRYKTEIKSKYDTLPQLSSLRAASHRFSLLLPVVSTVRQSRARRGHVQSINIEIYSSHDWNEILGEMTLPL